MNLNEPAFYWEDDHLAELFRDAERARPWYMRINWGPIVGALIAIGFSALCWVGLLKAVIFATRWYR